MAPIFMNVISRGRTFPGNNAGASKGEKMAKPMDEAGIDISGQKSKDIDSLFL